MLLPLLTVIMVTEVISEEENLSSLAGIEIRKLVCNVMEPPGK